MRLPIKPLKRHILLSCIGFFFFIATANGQTQDMLGDWAIKCEPACSANQQLSSNESNLKFTAVVSNSKFSDAPVMRLIFPLGIYLPTDIGLQVGSINTKVPVVTCLPSGCNAVVVLSEPFIDAMSTNTQLIVSYFSNENTANELSFSLAGFSDVLEQLANEN
uniref:invasion associated locus B family protein n=1 Tax=Ningiella ruwaisensis TaxID=2364274 RepID=UPI00109F4D51|nr:invasion associated locus B family protein [Ningiella ruwaisensis]